MKFHSLPVRSAIYQCPTGGRTHNFTVHRPGWRVWLARGFLTACVVLLVWEWARYAEVRGWL